MRIINTSQFETEINKELTLVDFFAEWCGPCKMLTPFLEQLETDHPELNIVKVNVDNDPDIASKYGIQSIPCLILFKKGELVKQEVGFKNKQMLETFIK